MLQRLWLANTFEGCALDFLNEGVDALQGFSVCVLPFAQIESGF
jgi:hypothetical protein